MPLWDVRLRFVIHCGTLPQGYNDRGERQQMADVLAMMRPLARYGRTYEHTKYWDYGAH